ncbi:MAG: UDP-N-acetylglucosamine pyrophosphorylase [Desulfomonilia bacterium]
MDMKPRCYDKIKKLLEKGVDLPNPLTLDIGEDVDVSRISGRDVTIYPGCRIYGKRTVISSGCRIGREGPVTIEDCQLGRSVELKGGYFSRSVFLEKANMGLGAHVREGSILEEEAGGAHCVGLKQTILFPFVTLGSLINFCDCLMAGGTSRRNHSEVGSSYIHFNFTPDGDKSTPSLIGDVPRGVMLREAPIFLGGQGGMVGPLRVGFGTVVAAGTVLRQDFLEDNRLVTSGGGPGTVREYRPALYPGLERIVRNNLIYLANLAALREWYVHVRRPFLEAEEFGELIHAGLLDKLSLAVKERLKRLEALAERVSRDPEAGAGKDTGIRRSLAENFHKVADAFTSSADGDPQVLTYRGAFLEGLHRARQESGKGYVEVIQALPAEVSSKGTKWLECAVASLCMKASEAVPGLEVYDRKCKLGSTHVSQGGSNG